MSVRPSPAPEPQARVPRTLRAALAGHELPRWLREASGLSEGATVDELRLEQFEGRGAVSARRVERFFVALVASRPSDIRNVLVLDRPWPADLEPRLVPWPDRTRARLNESGLIDDRQALSRVTYGDLLAVPLLGVRTVFAFAVAAQDALDRAHGGVGAPQELVELARTTRAAQWARLISGEDPRFGDLLANRCGTLADWLEAATDSQARTDLEAWLGIALLLPEVWARIERIEQSPLDLALHVYVKALSGLEGERLHALLERLGLDGRPPRTLSGAANGSGVSRERIRQWQVRITDRLPSHPVYMPALDRALELLADTAPTSVDEGATLLQERGVSTVPFHPASVLAAARLCARRAGFEVELTPKGAQVVTEAMRSHAPHIVRLAAQRVRSFGAASIIELARAALGEGVHISEAEARQALACYSDAEFLDEDWFWFPGARQNGLSSLTRTILAVTSPLDIATVRTSVCRAFRRRRGALIPSETVMRLFYDADPHFTVDKQDRVQLVDQRDRSTELGKIERVLVDVFDSSRATVLTRASLRDACLARGMSTQQFNTSIMSSPLLSHPANDTWCLVGAHPSRREISALRHARAVTSHARRVRAHGWTSEGALWIAAIVPRKDAGAPVIHIPKSEAHHVAGRRFTAQTGDGSPAGKITVSAGGESWGYDRFLSLRNDESELLHIEFRLTDSKAVLTSRNLLSAHHQP